MSRRRHGATALLVAGAVIALTGIGIGALRSGDAAPDPASQRVPVVDRGVLPPDPPSTGGPPSTRGTGTHHPRTGAPVPAGSRLRLTRLHVDARIVDVQAPGNTMTVPQDPHVVGWWSEGTRPGAPDGTVVIVGHINYAGVSGALSVLPDTRPGDEVEIAEPGTTLHYRVTAVRTYAKSSGIPDGAFATTGPARLALITCGGPFDPSTGNYEDNIVTYADPV